MNKLSWVGVALTASLCFNLFFVGLFAIHAFNRHDRGAMMAERGPIRSSVPEAVHAALAKAAAERQGDLTQLRRDMQQHRREIAKALSAEPFDRDALRQALVDAQGLQRRAQEQLMPILIDAAADLPADLRPRLVGMFLNTGTLQRVIHDRRGPNDTPEAQHAPP